jgi:predicted HTH transcriptional regulator
LKTLDEILIAEATEYDFKVSLEEIKPVSWLKSVSAFANGFGGSLYFGVDNNGTVIGLADAKKTADRISELIFARIEPALTYVLEPLLIDGKEILRLVVKSGINTPYYYKSGDNRTAYYRSGSESVKVTERIHTELILKGTHRTFDALESDYLYPDHSFTMLNSAYKKSTGKSLILPDDLISFGLLSKDNRLTYAGALFADYCPVYNSRIFCTRWSGLSMGTGLIDALDDAEYSANALTLIQNGIDFMRKHNRIMWGVIDLLRVEYPDYPQEAIREALINAVIHRDYSVKGSEVHLDIFDDRMEITSPGGMYDSKPIQELDLNSVPSTRRNPAIADLFQRIDYAERRGTGLKKILNGYENSDRNPVFFSTESWFKATLYNLNYGVESRNEDDSGGNGGSGGSGGSGGLNGGNRILLINALRDEPTIKIADLSEKTGVPQRTVERALAQLKKEGVIKRLGSNRAGRWEVVDE